MCGAMMLPALTRAKAKASGIRCMNNVKQLNLALMMYSADNADRFPAGTNWCDALIPYLGQGTNAFLCPLGARNQRCHYALNAGLAGHGSKDSEVSPARLVLVFECDGGWNVSGGRERLPANPRHTGACVVGFADGHAEMVRSPRLEQLRWEP